MSKRKIGEIVTEMYVLLKELSEYEDNTVIEVDTVEDATTSTSKPVDSYPIVCSDCGVKTTVPFKPNPKWAARCMDCYKKVKK